MRAFGDARLARGLPMGGDLDTYRATAEELEAEIRRVFDHFAADRVPGAS